MKTITRLLLSIAIISITLFSCKKEEVVYVPDSKILPGNITSSGDTVIVSSTNVTFQYTSTSPCYPSNEIFFFKITQSSFSNPTYTWDFGDGGKDTGSYVQHKYDYGNVYTVTLSVWANNTVQQQITTAVKPYGQHVSPIAIFGSQLNSYLDPNYIAFNAQSSVTSGSIINYFWEWKDGTTSSVATSYVEHRFPEIAKDSTYPVKLTVTSHAGCKASVTNNVYVPASYNNVGGISYTKTPACAPDSERITFTQDITNLPSNAIFYWDFGDGTQGTGNPITHHYTYSKTYPIICKIEIPGTVKKIFFRNVSVYALGDDIEPTAYINKIIRDTLNKFSFEFNGWGKVGDSHIITKLVWDFGDGTTDTNNTPYAYHTYHPATTPAYYTVKLTVTASSGCKDSVITIPQIYIP